MTAWDWEQGDAKIWDQWSWIGVAVARTGFCGETVVSASTILAINLDGERCGAVLVH